MNVSALTRASFASAAVCAAGACRPAPAIARQDDLQRKISAQFHRAHRAEAAIHRLETARPSAAPLAASLPAPPPPSACSTHAHRMVVHDWRWASARGMSCRTGCGSSRPCLHGRRPRVVAAPVAGRGIVVAVGAVIAGVARAVQQLAPVGAEVELGQIVVRIGRILREAALAVVGISRAAVRDRAARLPRLCGCAVVRALAVLPVQRGSQLALVGGRRSCSSSRPGSG